MPRYLSNFESFVEEWYDTNTSLALTTTMYLWSNKGLTKAEARIEFENTLRYQRAQDTVMDSDDSPLPDEEQEDLQQEEISV